MIIIIQMDNRIINQQFPTYDYFIE